MIAVTLPHMENSLAERIRVRLNKTQQTARSASMAAGLSTAFIQNILAGKSQAPRSDTMAKMAVVLQTTAEWLLTGEGDEEISEARRPKEAVQPATMVPGDSLVGVRDLPVFPAAMGGEGHVIITFDPIDYVKRPSVLEHVKDGYGLLIVGESMVPAYRPGDTALVHPRLPPTRDTDVVLFHVPPHDEAECIIKQLNGWNDREWMLEQFQPPKVFSESRADWPICHRVVGKYNRR